MSEKQQRLVLSIIDFLDQSINDGTIREEDKESLEVAGTSTLALALLRHLFPPLVQCIGEAFGVDPADQEQANRLSVKPATLQSIFEVYLKTKDKIGSTAQRLPAQLPPLPRLSRRMTRPRLRSISRKEMHMNGKQYDEAIDAYTKAIERDPSNPVYFSNRAAAHSSKPTTCLLLSMLRKQSNWIPSLSGAILV
jgi:small glutamine-rich tetratricopeptide repeat-containing protein alpha